MSKKFFAVLSLVILASMVLAACTPTTVVETVTVVETQVVEVPVEGGGSEAITFSMPEAKGAAGEVGGWVDEISMSVVSSDTAVTQIEAGAIDIFGGTMSTPEQLEASTAAGLDRSAQFGIFYELTFNPAGDPAFAGNGVFNPFSNNNIRVAMNWLVDRNYLNQEVYGGNSVPKWLPIVSGFPDYAKYVDVIREKEAEYAYDYDRAAEVIATEMEAMGATMGGDGFYTYEGETIEVVFLIRTDSDGTRVPIGDYVADQLESIGIKVDRQYKTSSEASVFWIQSDPNDGTWHIYTGAWSVGGINRDQGGNFQFYYSPNSVYGSLPLWQNYTVSDEFLQLTDDLNNNNFSTEEERRELFSAAIDGIFDHMYRVWLIDGRSFSTWTPELGVAYDLAAGVDINALWPFTLKGDDGAVGLVSWGNADLFIEPPNPIAGSNWTFDTQWILATNDAGVLLNPHTGVALPQRIERAEVTVVEGLPVTQTYDWVTLDFAAEVAVPADAWIDWDSENQVFIEAGDGVTAQRKSVVYYPDNLFTDVYWHDGSPMTIADFVMPMIMTFEPAAEGSALYDEGQAGSIEAFKSSFKGWRIVSESPLVMEFYSDVWFLDAESNVTTFWPAYGQSDAAWHQIAVGNLAEANGELAYSIDKADSNDVEWMSFIGGPSLGILNKYLGQALSDAYIPFEPTLGQWVTAEEAQTRYARMQAWFNDHGHFWIGTGPYMLDEVFLVEKTLTLVHNPFYPDPADKWLQFAEPALAEVEIDGAATVAVGEEVSFDVFVTLQGAPYPSDSLDSVKYLLFDASGALVEVGEATAAGDGLYNVTVTTEGEGTHTLEIAVVSIDVSVPSFATFEFVAE